MAINPKELSQSAGYPSLDALARRVLEIWETLDDERKPSARSLGAKVGALGRDDGIRWWQRRPRALEALAEALDLAPEELGASRPSEDSALHLFPGCPQLRPLDLRRERPCEIASWNGVWGVDRPGQEFALGPARSERSLTHSPLFHPFRRQPEHIWARVRSGWGRTLLARSFALADRTALVEAETLHLAVDKARTEGPGPLILSTARSDPATDLEALRQLRRRGDEFLVLAPHPPPRRRNKADRYRTWDEGPYRSREEAETGPNWWTIELTPAHDWRLRLLHWSARRSSEPFDPDRVHRWLLALDPEERWVSTPAALISILGLYLRLGAVRATRKTRQQLAQLGALPMLGAGEDDWLREEGSALVRRLARARAGAVRHPAVGALTLADWSGLVPDDALPGTSGDGQVATKGALAREAIRRLTRAAAFRRRAGGLELGPGWVVDVESAAEIEALVGEPVWPLWGRVAAEPDRRSLVDEALDGLSPAGLSTRVRSVLDDPPSLARSAALDALCCCVGRNEVSLSSTLANELLAEVLSTCLPVRQGVLPRLFSRGGPGQAEERLGTLLALWGWARANPMPEGDPKTYLDRLTPSAWDESTLRLAFPSWWAPAGQSLSSLLDSWLGVRTGRSYDKKEGQRDGEPFRELSYGRQGRRLMDSLRTFASEVRGEWPDMPAPWLVAARLASSEGDLDWLNAASLEALGAHGVAVDWLEESFASLPSERRAELAVQACRVIIPSKDGLQTLPEPLSRLLQREVPSQAVGGLVADVGYQWCRSFFSWSRLDPRLRLELARLALSNPHAAREFWEWLFGSRSFFGSDDVDVLELLASSRIRDLGMAAEELWRVSPERARALAVSELRSRCEVGLVCRAAPEGLLAPVADEIGDALRDRAPAWLPPWLREQAAGGGVLAELAFDSP